MMQFFTHFKITVEEQDAVFLKMLQKTEINVWLLINKDSAGYNIGCVINFSIIKIM